jgi:hypothetical protein
VAGIADSPTRISGAAARVIAPRTFRSSQIDTFYKAKTTYDAKRDSQDKLLRSGPKTSWDFVVNEKTRFNPPETGELAKIGAIDQRSSADIQRCLRRGCRD